MRGFNLTAAAAALLCLAVCCCQSCEAAPNAEQASKQLKQRQIEELLSTMLPIEEAAAAESPIAAAADLSETVAPTKLAENSQADDQNLIDRIKSILGRFIVEQRQRQRSWLDNEADESARAGLHRLLLAGGFPDASSSRQPRADRQFQEQKFAAAERQQADNGGASSGHKVIRDVQQVYMRLPPRFGKRAGPRGNSGAARMCERRRHNLAPR